MNGLDRRVDKLEQESLARDYVFVWRPLGGGLLYGDKHYPDADALARDIGINTGNIMSFGWQNDSVVEATA